MYEIEKGKLFMKINLIVFVINDNIWKQITKFEIEKIKLLKKYKLIIVDKR